MFLRNYFWLVVLLVFTQCETSDNEITTRPIPAELPVSKEESLLLLEKDLEIIKLHPPEYDSTLKFDIISFTENTAEAAVTLINKTDINPDSIDCLTKNVSYQNLCSYSFGFWSGGTRGFVTYSILVWKNGNKYVAANLSRNINFEIEQIIPLNEQLYLLIGSDKAYSNTINDIAYVVNLAGDKIDINYPAFANRPYLNFYNSVYKYDSVRGVLKYVSKYDFVIIEDEMNSEEKYGSFAQDKSASRRLFEMIEDSYYFNKEFELRFNGTSFEAIPKDFN